MKFIFPQNYTFKNKLLGMIDYTTALINVVWYIFVLFLVCSFFSSFSIRVFLFILFCLPLLLFSFAGFNGENILYVFSYLLRFTLKQKLYFYRK